MSVLSLLRPTEITAVPEDHLVVVHPLDDAPEQKVDTEAMGPMPLTRTVKASLMVLRGYLILMILLVLYHVIDLAGVFGKNVR